MRLSRRLNRPPDALRDRRRLSRVLVASIAVVGVLAMHGLTMNHDGAMVSMSPIVPVAAPFGHLALVNQTAPVGAPAMRPTTVTPPSAALSSGTAASSFGLQATTGVMSSACLAVLGGLVLLSGTGRVSGRSRRDVGTGPTRYDVAWVATAVDRLRPDLGELSVLRT